VFQPELNEVDTMKIKSSARILFAASTLAGAASAHAQSAVTLYGMVDDGIAYSSNQNGHSNVYLAQGTLYANKFGLKGVEDLGGGTAAIFDLQAGFNLNNGAFAQQGSIFNRYAWIGLKNSSAGTFTMGRQYTPYTQFLNPLAPSSFLTGATGAHPGDVDGLDTTTRVNNSFIYTTPTIGGFSASGMYALGGVAGATGKGQTISAAVRYANGPLSVAAGYQRLDNGGLSPGLDPQSTASYAVSALNRGYVSARSVRNVATAGTYVLGGLTLGLNYSNVRFLPGGNSLFTDTAVFNSYGTFGMYRFTPDFSVAGAFAYTVASKANGVSSAARYQQYSLKEAYSLSKRTTIYAVQGYQRANGQTLGVRGAGNVVDATATVGDSQNGTPSATNSQFVGMIGITAVF
jgi:predicted porin